MAPKLIIGLGLLFTIIISSFAQNQANIWYFGNGAGLNFNNEEPVPLNDGRITVTANTGENEGSSTICDHEGNLLFYSEGQTIWNRNHQIMPNGSGLLGHNSSTHPAFAVPLPLSSRFFYLFTTDSFHHTRLENGFRFTVIDMCREDGLGDVVPDQKNILLEDLMTEKIAVTRHANGVDYWIVTHKYNSTNFLAYRLTPDGLDIDNIVVSNIGTLHGYENYPEGLGAAIGQMKISPNGQKLALCVINISPNILEMFDFDTQTGIVTNPINFAETIGNNLGTGAGSITAYGTEFSPDNTKLYFSSSSGIFQFDLSLGGNEEILNSYSRISTNENNKFVLGMQLAPNGKIYISSYNEFSLSAIENPNEKGEACNFVEEAQTLGNRTSSFSFPSFIAGFDYSNAELEECEEPDCSGEPGGTRIIDQCDECLQPDDPSFNQSCADCMGTPNGNFMIDNCDLCLLPDDPDFNQTCVDCAGVTGGDRIIDACGECISRNDPNINQSCIDCAGEPNGVYQVDQCGECLSPYDPDFGQSCLDCMGIAYGPHFLDVCGECIDAEYYFYYGESCIDCLYPVTEGFMFDDCGKCKHIDDETFNQSCADCAGTPDGTFILDECGECLPPDDPNFNLSCVDCAGINGGDSQLDECGQCLPPNDPDFNQSCADCAGTPNGNFILDECGECLLPNDLLFNLSCVDCAGIIGGDSQLDECGQCLSPNNPDFNQSCADCAGTPNGNFVLDECGECLLPNDPLFNLSCLSAKIFIPNAFSPNDDGINDFFKVHSNNTLPVQIINYIVYNRWGNIVYIAQNFDVNDNRFWWDGFSNNQKQPLGVYAYYIEAEILNEPLQKLKGNVTLVR